VRAARRSLHDQAARTRFASNQGVPATFPHLICEYDRLLICYPGQENAFEGKSRNCALALSACDGTVIAPGEVFSFWRSVGRPTAAAGYAAAAALRKGVLMQDVGGAVCLVSTVLYNVALLGGQRIEERHCHSVDSYGDARYFQLGRDAAVEYAYLDLRFRNLLPRPVLLRATIDEDHVVAQLWAAQPVSLSVRLAVSPPEMKGALLRVHTHRTATLDGAETRDDLGWSVHRIPGQPGP
jgi:vancomycin resistance protein VanW